MNAEDKKANGDQIPNEKAEHARASGSGGIPPEGRSAKREPSETQKPQEASAGQQTPEEESERIKADLEHSSAVNRSLLIFFLLAMTYFLVIVASTTDLQLLLPNSTIKLPILNVDLDLIKFYLFSPFILIVIHYNFLFSLCQHTKKLCRLRILEPDNDDPLPHSSFLINLLIKPKKIRGKQAVGGNGPKDNRVPYYLIRCLLWIVIYLYPLFILVLFQWRFADYHDLLKTLLHLLYLALDISLLSFFWIRISDPLFESQPLHVFEKNDEKPRLENPNAKPRMRRSVCSEERDTLGKLVFFFPCLIGSLLYYLKRNTGMVNFVVIALLALIQVRTIGLLLWLDSLPPGRAYRIVNNYKYIAVPRLKIINTPIVAHFRQLASPGGGMQSGRVVVDSKPPKVSGEESSDKPDNPCVAPPDRSNLNLLRLDLSGRDLRFAILNGSDLTSVVLSGAILKGSSLMSTILENADMDEINLKGANLRGARLQCAKLPAANLEEAILESANMQYAGLSQATLNGADMTWVRLDGAFLARAQLVGAIMYRSSLTGVSADLASFRAADLSGANLSRSSLRGADFYAADLSTSIFTDAVLVDADLSVTDLDGSDLGGAKLLGTNLSASSLKSVDFTNVKLTGVNLRYAQLWDADVKPDMDLDKSRVYGLYYYLAISGTDKKEICNQYCLIKDNLLKYRDLGAKIILKVNHSLKNESKDDYKSIGESCDSSSESLFKDDRVVLIEMENDKEAALKARIIDAQRTIDSEVIGLNYRLRTKIVCDSVYTAKGIVRQLLFEKELEHQRRALFDHLKQNCPSIADQVVPK